MSRSEKEEITRKEHIMRWKQFLTPVSSISGSEAKKIMTDLRPDAYNLVDVRQPSEYEAHHIPGAKLIPIAELDKRMNELDPTKPTMVY
jgi:rhodanese-related sulfurtransferase